MQVGSCAELPCLHTREQKPEGAQQLAAADCLGDDAAAPAPRGWPAGVATNYLAEEELSPSRPRVASLLPYIR